MNTKMKHEFSVRTIRTFAVVMFATAMLLAVGSAVAGAAAQVTTTCDGLVTTLRTDTVNATSLSDKDKGALLFKVDSAAVKLSEGKFCDALQKLNDYKSNLDALHFAAKPKISDADYALLSGDVGNAIGCVTNLVCAAGSTCGDTVTCPAP
jgi:hypothetical protein